MEASRKFIKVKLGNIIIFPNNRTTSIYSQIGDIGISYINFYAKS